MAEKSMEELESLVGTSVVTVEDFEIEAGKVEEFARAVTNDDPVHRSSEAARDRRLDAIPASLTFTRTSYFSRYWPSGIDESLGFDLEFRLERVLHGEQLYEFERPVFVGDEPTGETTLVDVYQREGDNDTLTFAVYETEFRDVDDEPVITARNTRIETPEPEKGD